MIKSHLFENINTPEDIEDFENVLNFKINEILSLNSYENLLKDKVFFSSYLNDNKYIGSQNTSKDFVIMYDFINSEKDIIPLFCIELFKIKPQILMDDLLYKNIIYKLFKDFHPDKVLCNNKLYDFLLLHEYKDKGNNLKLFYKNYKEEKGLK